MIQRVSIIGLGKLGACMAAAMASKGLHVIGVDVNPEFVSRINAGRAPVVEPGLEEMLAANRSRLQATTDYHRAIHNSDASFVIVPSPSDGRGSFSLKFVQQAAREIGNALARKAGYHLVAVTSTVLPGSTQFGILPLLEQASGKQCGKEFGLCYNPEFIALGSVIRDLLNPDFVLIGESDPRAGEALEGFYASLCDNHPTVRRMNFVNAELTKIAVNTFVTTKITFANMLAGMCEELPGADIDVVSEALGSDSRIGRRYLTGALGYGGPCFPRDNRALSFLAQTLGSRSLLAEATDRLNQMLLERQVEQVKKLVGCGKTVAVLGLAYKPDTNVIEESQGVALAQSLVGNGNRVIVFDPLALEAARQVLKDKVTYARTLAECLQQADAVLVALPSREFRALRPADFPMRAQPILLFDCWRILREHFERYEGVRYIPLGLGSHDPVLTQRLLTMWQADRGAGTRAAPESD